MAETQEKPTILVTAFNRPESLARLFRSLAAACYPQGTPLLISIDHGGCTDVVKLAQDFDWPAGPKTVRVLEQRLGLALHQLSACELAAESGAFIQLDDDLYVSPYFYEFALAALAAYRNEPRVCGISLYSHKFNETANQTFTPLDDGYDVFLLQLMTWGHVWTAEQWWAFRNWHNARKKSASNGAGASDSPKLQLNGVRVPRDVCSWPETSWKKHFISYMVAQDLYCAVPRISYVTNFADSGVHHVGDTNFLQVELAGGARHTAFPAFDKSRAVYDAWCEFHPRLLAQALAASGVSDEVCVDLYGTKDPQLQTAPYMLTTQATRRQVARFGLKLRPREANVLHGIEGDEIALAPTESVISRRVDLMPYYEYAFAYDHLRLRDMVNAIGTKLMRRVGAPFRQG